MPFPRNSLLEALEAETPVALELQVVPVEVEEVTTLLAMAKVIRVLVVVVLLTAAVATPAMGKLLVGAGVVMQVMELQAMVVVLEAMAVQERMGMVAMDMVAMGMQQEVTMAVLDTLSHQVVVVVGMGVGDQ